MESDRCVCEVKFGEASNAFKQAANQRKTATPATATTATATAATTATTCVLKAGGGEATTTTATTADYFWQMLK